MVRIGAAHPGYGFERHMGYSVPEHFRALAKLGPCEHHRRSFSPVALARGEVSLRQELDLTGGTLLRRPWPAHPDCTCGAPRSETSGVPDGRGTIMG